MQMTAIDATAGYTQRREQHRVASLAFLDPPGPFPMRPIAVDGLPEAELVTLSVPRAMALFSGLNVTDTVLVCW